MNSVMESAKQTAGSGLSFRVSEDGKQLVAVYAPSGKRVDGNGVRKRIADAGFRTWFVLDDAVIKLVELLNSAEKPGELVVAESRDGQVEIEISRDKMMVFVSIVPPYGDGQAVGHDDVIKALADKGVVHGIDNDAIAAALTRSDAARVQVASGDAPIDGDDAQFVSLLPQVKERRPRMDTDGAIDYRDLGDVSTVAPGDKLMKRVAATPGKAGTNVFGQRVAAKPGKDFSYSPALKGVKRLPADPEVLVADIFGQPVLVDLGMTVEPTLSVEAVDLATGHIYFEGTVKVAGDIIPGMKVTATADVFVGGLVEAAYIRAGGDVVVKGGVIGHGDLRDEAGEISRGAAIVEADGSVSASFVENAQVTAGVDIMIGDRVGHSELEAGNKVCVGKKGSKHGSIMGGLTKAGVAIKALTLGSPLGIATRVAVGDIKETEKRLTEVTAKYEQTMRQREKLTLACEKLQASSAAAANAATLKKARLTVESLNTEIFALGEEAAHLRQQIEAASKAKVLVGKQVFTNVQVTVKDKFKNIKEERGGGAFYIEEYDLVFGWAKF